MTRINMDMDIYEKLTLAWVEKNTIVETWFLEYKSKLSVKTDEIEDALLKTSYDELKKLSDLAGL